MAYSKDFRQQVLGQLAQGKTHQQLAHEYNISTRTILNWTKQPERKVRTAYFCKISLDDLTQDVKDYPDAYQKGASLSF